MHDREALPFADRVDDDPVGEAAQTGLLLVRGALRGDEIRPAQPVAQLVPRQRPQPFEVEVIPRLLVRERDIDRRRAGVDADDDHQRHAQPDDDDAGDDERHSARQGVDLASQREVQGGDAPLAVRAQRHPQPVRYRMSRSG